MKELLLVLSGSVAGSVITLIVIWLQSFSSAAAQKAVKEEMDQARAEELKKLPRNNSLGREPLIGL